MTTRLARDRGVRRWGAELLTRAVYRRAVASGAALALASGCSDSPAELGPQEQANASAALEDDTIARATPIVFRSDRDELGQRDLYLMQLDGGGVERLTYGGDFFFPKWSPGGDAIAFRQNVNGADAEVGVIAPNGTPPVTLTEGEVANAWFLPVNWTPDGTRLAFASWVPEGAALWSLPRGGGVRDPFVPALPGQQNSAAWSLPGAEKIVYIDVMSRLTEDVWVASADGTEPVNLTEGQVFRPEYPQWSPDGTRVAVAGFALLPDGSLPGHSSDAGIPHKDIFVIDVATREVTRLTAGDAENDMPAWAPDGQSLYVSSDRDGDYDIWQVPLDAPELARNLIDDADNPRDDSMPDAYWPRL